MRLSTTSDLGHEGRGLSAVDLHLPVSGTANTRVQFEERILVESGESFSPGLAYQRRLTLSKRVQKSVHMSPSGRKRAADVIAVDGQYLYDDGSVAST